MDQWPSHRGGGHCVTHHADSMPGGDRVRARSAPAMTAHIELVSDVPLLADDD